MRRVAIYDLSRAYVDKPFCSKLNETESVVFQEYEGFLDKEYKIEIKAIYRFASRQPIKPSL